MEGQQTIPAASSTSVVSGNDADPSKLKMGIFFLEPEPD